MCGIAGYIGSKPIEQSAIAATLDRMKNRGPDDREFRSYQQGGTYISLLHGRLSIIDLDSRANQPFAIGDCTIIFNGEIYNYVELRESLQKKGISFHTESDTEVLLQAYILYGEDCVQHLEGMWAFAIWNSKAGRLFLSRDRFGEKPLYYRKTEQGFYFGSEVKFLESLSAKHLQVLREQVQRYLALGYKSLYKHGQTFFEDVYEVPAGSSFVISADAHTGYAHKVLPYWKPQSTINASMTLEEAVQGTRERLVESMRIRLRADVPLAFCLSGGVDSASLVSIAAKVFQYDVATFSIIDADERYNEEDNIRAVINDTGCAHTLIHLSHEGTLERLQQLIAYHDAPVATPTYLVHSMLSEVIHAQGYKVAFSGTSADEIFTGYYDHFLLHLYEMRHHAQYEKYLVDWHEHTGKFIRNPLLKNPHLYEENPHYREHVYDNHREFRTFLRNGLVEEFTENTYTDSLLRNRMWNELLVECTPVILHEDDLNSMLYSIENRSPFLDTKLVEFAYSIPNDYLIQNGYGKYVLREAMEGILVDQVRLDRRKKGFNASINSLFNLSDNHVREYFLDPSAEIFEYVDRDKVLPMFDMNPASNEYSKFLFSFMNTRIFLEQHAG
jgi:asparagine synthase (glutamine-hydrolysing)